MRHMLASVILRLLGSRVVHEDPDQFCSPALNITSKTEVDMLMEASAAATDLPGECLFDCLLLVLHGLLSSFPPTWLKKKSSSKSTTESNRSFSVFDREVAESLQV